MPDDTSLRSGRDGADAAVALAAARAEATRLRYELDTANRENQRLRTQLSEAQDTIEALDDEVYDLENFIDWDMVR